MLIFAHAYQPLVGIHTRDVPPDRRRDRLQPKRGGQAPEGENGRHEDGQEGEARGHHAPNAGHQDDWRGRYRVRDGPLRKRDGLQRHRYWWRQWWVHPHPWPRQAASDEGDHEGRQEEDAGQARAEGGKSGQLATARRLQLPASRSPAQHDVGAVILTCGPFAIRRVRPTGSHILQKPLLGGFYYSTK